LFKSIIESAQILSTVQWMYGAGNEHLYRPTHQRHPCVQWAARNRRNYLWLVRHLKFAIAEWHYRGYRHSRVELKVSWLESCPPSMPQRSDGCSRFVNCTPYRKLPLFEAYQKHLNRKWQASRATWTRRNPPEWRDSSAQSEDYRSGSGERDTYTAS